MKQKFYVHCSDLKIIKWLNESDLFEHNCHYHPLEFSNCHRNEWGRLKIKDANLQFIVGELIDFSCPWCGEDPVLKQEKPGICFETFIFYMKCNTCGSCGPKIVLHISNPSCEKTMRVVGDMIKQKYATRRAWDHNIGK